MNHRVVLDVLSWTLMAMIVIRYLHYAYFVLQKSWHRILDWALEDDSHVVRWLSVLVRRKSVHV